jgi:hypothetical protein
LKTNITLRSPLSNVSWFQRGAAALLTAALIFTFAFAWRPNTHTPAPTPATHQTAPQARNPNYPVIGAGSAYDGGSYVTTRPPAPNPNNPVIGTGSVYDGQ